MSVYSDIEYIACLDHNNIVCLFLQRLSVKVYIITTFNRCIDHISFVTINNGILIHVWIWYDVKNRSWRYCNSETVTRDVFLYFCNILRLYKIKCTIEATSTLLNTYPMSFKKSSNTFLNIKCLQNKFSFRLESQSVFIVWFICYTIKSHV